MDIQAALHWLYVVAMAIGAFYFVLLSKNPRGVPKQEYVVAIFIPTWSGLAYMAMALDQGKVEIAGQLTHYARYIDWLVTTPLLLLALGWTAMQTVDKDKPLLMAVMGTDVVMITSGLIADLSQGWTRYLWYGVGCIAFVVIMSLIWGPFRVKTRGQGLELSSLYDRLLIYFTVLWIGYPIAWIIGPSGLGFIDQTIDTLLFCILPFFSKVGFSFLDLHGLRNLHLSRARNGMTTRALR
ncbi:bacteriorhodopsin [Oculatella sp. LEGE 06141]|uniref:bacteriorhodopsin n=1 Tax=Oculatella sp. LEGE 06141 TaxID=1828648 RepID=UPI001882EECD|nr:bacteriorhodopsin [Oculatella sp. LEGE 06141]MBE9179986.1 bacteriorhodopsin [Oculatella sp. LEGE 06141]